MADEIKEQLPPLNKQEFREKLTNFLETADKVEERIVRFQEEQGKKSGEGILLEKFSATDRKRFFDLNDKLLKQWHDIPLGDPQISQAISEDSESIAEMEHDFYRPFFAYISVIGLLENRLRIGEKYEEEFEQETSIRAPWTDSALIRHCKKVLRSFSGEVLGKPKKEKFNIVEIIGDVATILRANSQVGLFEDLPKNAIEINFESEEEIMINGRENDLYRVFYNILRNSEKILGRNFKNTKQKGVIDIEVKEDEEKQQVIVNLVDNGPGIDAGAVLTSAIKAGVTTREEGEKMTEEEKLQLIFFPGVTGFAEIGIRDTGKGLSICRRIIKEHDGTIEIRSKTGVGTTFIINLPK